MRFVLNDHIRDVREPPIGEVLAWAAERKPGMPSLIDLCQAVPDYSPPPELLGYLRTVVDDPQTCRYTVDEGLPEVREAVCDRYRRRYRAKISPRQICLTCGASQAFWLAIMVLCRAGDEVILQSPCYFDHPMALGALGIRAVYAPFKEKRKGLPDPVAIAGLITARTRAIILVSPGNPTGMAVDAELMREMFFMARRHGVALLLDETYSDFIEGVPHDLFAMDDWYRNLVQVMSFGKSYALTGYRAGLLAASEEFVRQALKVQDTMAVCQPRITQMALKYGLDRLDGWLAGNRLMMSLRHNLFTEEFNLPGNRFRLVSSGSFFAWVKHPWSGRSSREVVKRLVQEAGLLTLPGEAFGPGLEQYIRLAFGNIREKSIPDAVRRFRQSA